ncbi:MAG: GNAT family N-acetyltransferase [Clostridia bacterium]|nr:GNAT family N-acetyltransferase [Clostridia bacterium]
MNTLRYKPEQCDELRKFLTDTPNEVELPSDVFFEIAKLPDNEKLSKLLRKAYTMVAVENEEIVGVAAMDKEGNIGIFCVRGGENRAKATRLLSAALDRRAEKRELSALAVSPTENCSIAFKDYGYAPFDGDGEPNEFLLVKYFEKKIDFPPSSVKTIKLVPSKYISVEGKTSDIPWLLLWLAFFFATLFIIITVARYGSEYFYRKQNDFITIGIVVGIFFLGAVSLFTAYRIRAAKLKKEVLSMRVTNAFVISHAADSFWDLQGEHYYTKSYRSRVPDKTSHSLTYQYYDENMELREAHFSHRYFGRGPYFYKGQELVVACSGEKSYILRRYTVQSCDGGEVRNVEAQPVSTKSLKGYIPLYCVKMYYVFALTFLIAFASVMVIALTLAIITMKGVGSTLGRELLWLLPLIIVGTVMFGLPSLGIFAFILKNKRKYKRILALPDTKVFEGKLVHGGGVYNAKDRLKFYCEYNDGEVKRMRVFRKFTAMLIKDGKFAVKVAVNGSTALVLVEKGKYPDVWSFFLPHY